FVFAPGFGAVEVALQSWRSNLQREFPIIANQGLRAEIACAIQRPSIARGADRAACSRVQPPAKVQPHGRLRCKLGSVHSRSSGLIGILAVQSPNEGFEPEIDWQVSERRLFHRTEPRFGEISERDTGLRING